MPGSPKLTVKKTEPSELAEKCVKLYSDLIPNLYDVDCPKFLTDVKVSLKDMRRLKYDINYQHERGFYTDIKYNEAAVRCAYLYAYSVLNTGIVYHEFSRHLSNRAEFIRSLLSKKTLKICCLAGGPATEAVAISEAISDFLEKPNSKTDLLTNVIVTVVDIVSEWKVDGEALINALNKSTDSFNVRNTHFHYNFLKADLISPLEEAVKVSIAEANIVTVIKFGSSIEEKSASVRVTYLDNMIKNVTDCMSNNRCLFMLDMDGGRIFRNNMEIVKNQQNRYALEMSLHKKYRLLPKTLQKMKACLNFRNAAETSTLFPTALTSVSSCLWIKKPPKSPKKNSKTVSDMKRSKFIA